MGRKENVSEGDEFEEVELLDQALEKIGMKRLMVDDR